MDSLFTIGIGHYHAVDLALRVASALVTGSALLLALSASCVPASRRLPLLIAAVGLGVAAWFEAGVSSAWRGAFELSGAAYCVTGLPMAGEDRVIAWELGIPVLLFCFGFLQMDRGSRGFRHLCVTTLIMALLGPVVFIVTVLGFLYSISLLRGMPPSTNEATSRCVTVSKAIGLAAMATGFALVMMGRLHLLPLGSSAETILVRGEIVRAASDVLALAIPAFALLTTVLNLREKE